MYNYILDGQVHAFNNEIAYCGYKINRRMNFMCRGRHFQLLKNLYKKFEEYLNHITNEDFFL